LRSDRARRDPAEPVRPATAMTLPIVLYTRPGEAAEAQAALASVPGIRLASVDNAAAFKLALEDAAAAILPMYLYDKAASQALREAPKLRWLQSMSIGTDRLLSDPAAAHLTVSTAGDAMAPAIADHAMALLLALARQMPAFAASQGARQWNPAPKERMESLGGKTLAIVGYGAIGREIGKRAAAFGMRVVGLRRTAAPDAHANAVLPIAALDDVLARAHAVAIAAPLSPQTRGLFDAARFARMRRGSLLVNVSRGGIVDTAALIEALASGQLGGAGLDVADPEPPPPDSLLWTAPNLVITPHVAAAGSGAQVADFVAANVRRFIAAEPLLSVHQHARN
jgi:phosphoglycerate dehydrogenase-like enzyme